jgi:hypothetical protein
LTYTYLSDTHTHKILQVETTFGNAFVSTKVQLILNKHVTWFPSYSCQLCYNTFRKTRKLVILKRPVYSCTMALLKLKLVIAH